MKNLLFLIIISILLLTCSDESSNPNELFSGNWKVYLSGDLSGEINFQIGNNSEFNNNLNVSATMWDSTVYIYTNIIGNVSSNGNLIAIIQDASTKSKLGNFTGTLSNTNGSGNYSWRYYYRTWNGEWTALKK